MQKRSNIHRFRLIAIKLKITIHSRDSNHLRRSAIELLGAPLVDPRKIVAGAGNATPVSMIDIDAPAKVMWKYSCHFPFSSIAFDASYHIYYYLLTSTWL